MTTLHLIALGEFGEFCSYASIEPAADHFEVRGGGIGENTENPVQSKKNTVMNPEPESTNPVSKIY